MTTPIAMSTSASSDDESTAPLRPIRVAVIGLSRPGIVHAAVASKIPNVELVGLVDGRSARRRDVRGVGFDVPMFDRLSALVDKARPDAVVVSVPFNQRSAIIRDALESGIAVLADRPLATSLLEVEALALISRERGVPLACAHSLLYDPVFAETRSILAQGPLGEPRRVRCSCYRSVVFRSERQVPLAADGAPGGVLAQEAIDALAFLVHTLGMPASVRATAQRLYGPLEDEVRAMLTYPSGTEAGLEASWSVPGYPTAATVLEFEGRNGKLLASADALEIDVLDSREGYRAGHARLGLADLEHRSRFVLDGESTYRMDAAFFGWVAGGPASTHRAELAVRTHRVMDALYQSAAGGGAPIALSRS